MDINEIKNVLKEKYNCEPVDYFKYGNHEFTKAVEIIKNGICYRYFDVTNNVIEIKDQILLDYFRKNNEINLDIEY